MNRRKYPTIEISNCSYEEKIYLADLIESVLYTSTTLIIDQNENIDQLMEGESDIDALIIIRK